MEKASRRRRLERTDNERQGKRRWAQLSKSASPASFPQGRIRQSEGTTAQTACSCEHQDRAQTGHWIRRPHQNARNRGSLRLITVREGDRTERIPVIQAILRKVALAAANGNVRAQQNYLNLVIGAEAARREATAEMLKAAVEYKEHWHRVLAERARNGATTRSRYLIPTTSSSTISQARSDSRAR
jgi:hypothetical protein